MDRTAYPESADGTAQCGPYYYELSPTAPEHNNSNLEEFELHGTTHVYPQSHNIPGPMCTVSASDMPVNHNTPANYYTPVEQHYQNEVNVSTASSSTFDREHTAMHHVAHHTELSTWNDLSIPNLAPMYEGHDMNNVNSLFAVSPALETLRASNGPLAAVNQIEEQSASLASPEDGYDAYWAHILGQMSDLAQSPTESNVPGTPIVNPIPGQMSDLGQSLDSNNGIQGASTMTNNSNASNSRRRMKQRSTIRGVRITCESCRKLHTKCLPTRDGSSCKECDKKGDTCVRKARAAYSKRAPKNTPTSTHS